MTLASERFMATHMMSGGWGGWWGGWWVGCEARESSSGRAEGRQGGEAACEAARQGMGHQPSLPPAATEPQAQVRSQDRMAPEEPMSAPTQVSRSFCSMKPSAHSA